ncbi:MAG: ATP-binding protein [Candidatus Marinimicrobia bacterium]|nr:ATP-binding protein [Candidatus Neomarinimicrobiota bacterium]
MKIAIASGKGGTGKTTLSTNLASFIAENTKVVLADLDVEEPNSKLFVHGELVHQEAKYKMIPEWVQNKCDLCGICREVCNFNAITQILDEIIVFPELCHGCYACSELCPMDALPMKPKKMGMLTHYETGDLSLIESKLDIGEEQAVPLIAQTLEYVDKTFPQDIVKIYDSPPGTSCPVIEATKHADTIILVTEPTPFGLHDLKLAVETIREIKKPFAVVINRHGIGDNKVEQYCEEENISIIATIPNQRKIAERYSEGKLLYKEIPAVRSALMSIMKYIDTLHPGKEIL